MARKTKLDRVVISLKNRYPRELHEYNSGDETMISFFLGETLKEVKPKNIKEIKTRIIELLEE